MKMAAASMANGTVSERAVANKILVPKSIIQETNDTVLNAETRECTVVGKIPNTNNLKFVCKDGPVAIGTAPKPAPTPQ